MKLVSQHTCSIIWGPAAKRLSLDVYAHTLQCGMSMLLPAAHINLESWNIAIIFYAYYFLLLCSMLGIFILPYTPSY